MSLLQSINTSFPVFEGDVIALSHTRNSSGDLSTFAELNKHKCSCFGCANPPRGDSPSSCTTTTTTTTTSSSSSGHISISMLPPPPHISFHEDEYQEPSMADRIGELKQKAIDALIVLKMALLDKQDDIYTSPSASTARLNILNMRHENLDREIAKIRKTIKVVQTVSEDDRDYV